MRHHPTHADSDLNNLESTITEDGFMFFEYIKNNLHLHFFLALDIWQEEY